MYETSKMKIRLTSKEKHRKRREERRKAYISAAKKREAIAKSETLPAKLPFVISWYREILKLFRLL
jgi:hypothetical protein